MRQETVCFYTRHSHKLSEIGRRLSRIFADKLKESARFAVSVYPRPIKVKIIPVGNITGILLSTHPSGCLEQTQSLIDGPVQNGINFHVAHERTFRVAVFYKGGQPLQN